MIVGRSILHHLLDYDKVLAQCARLLVEGGKAFFFEPLLEGKIVIALFGAMVAKLAERESDPDLSANDLKAIRAMIRHITLASWYPQDRESLAKIEDKFVFTLPGMRETCLKAGFKSVQFLSDDRPRDSSFWSYFTFNMKNLGIDPAKISKYQFLAEPVKQTLGQCSELFHQPMGYFCLSK